MEEENKDPIYWPLFILTTIIVIVSLAILGLAVVFKSQEVPAPSLQPTTTVSPPISFLGAMQGIYTLNQIYLGGEGPKFLETVKEKGIKGIYEDKELFTKALAVYEQKIKKNSQIASSYGIVYARDHPGFAWSIIEPEKGQFRFELTDLVAKMASDYGINVVAVIWPFTVWDQTQTRLNPKCSGVVDFYPFQAKMAPPNDWEEYRVFLRKTVERYQKTIKYWEIGNEPDAECGGFKNNPEGYVKLLSESAKVIKGACSDCIVINGGALELREGEGIEDFWKAVFEKGGQFIDIVNFHYNLEKFGIKKDGLEYQKHLKFFTNLAQGKPIWITEFGTYSGTPENMLGRPAQELPYQSEEEQTNWYVKRIKMGQETGVTVFFPDFKGDRTAIGLGAIFDEQYQPRAFLKALKKLSQERQVR